MPTVSKEISRSPFREVPFDGWICSMGIDGKMDVGDKGAIVEAKQNASSAM
jgi:hypothetical protein